MEKKITDRSRLSCRNSGKIERSDNHHRSSRVRRIKLFVSPTTGGCLEVCVPPEETVLGLKQVLSRKFKLPSDRIHLLFKDRVLKEGSLNENEVTESSRIILCPIMESGTMSHHAQHSVMQALQNLSDSQVNDFLSGHAPLTLAIRLGEHLMFVQLQLSTVTSRSQGPQPSTSTLPEVSLPTKTISSTTADINNLDAGPSVNSSFPPPVISPVSLVEASRNLTEKLKELTRLSQERLQSVPSMPPTPPPSPPPSPGAVIDSMQHHGKGVYSGTFSGTLDPRLQDGTGRPRRNVNTILHILHDLLVAQPASFMSRHNCHGPNNNTYTSPRDAGCENDVLRDKVHRIQMMLEERRQRRSARRDSHRPYPRQGSLSHCSSSHKHMMSSVDCNRPLATSSSSASSNLAANATSNSPSTPSSHAENVETSNYRKPNIEQETLAV